MRSFRAICLLKSGGKLRRPITDFLPVLVIVAMAGLIEELFAFPAFFRGSIIMLL
jgi:hypothetical protein